MTTKNGYKKNNFLCCCFNERNLNGPYKNEGFFCFDLKKINLIEFFMFFVYQFFFFLFEIVLVCFCFFIIFYLKWNFFFKLTQWFSLRKNVNCVCMSVFSCKCFAQILYFQKNANFSAFSITFLSGAACAIFLPRLRWFCCLRLCLLFVVYIFI